VPVAAGRLYPSEAGALKNAIDGGVTDESTEQFLADFMREFRTHVERVLTVIPRG
jgi:pantothenate kinase-related protein Tda10